MRDGWSAALAKGGLEGEPLNFCAFRWGLYPGPDEPPKHCPLKLRQHLPPVAMPPPALPHLSAAATLQLRSKASERPIKITLLNEPPTSNVRQFSSFLVNPRIDVFA